MVVRRMALKCYRTFASFILFDIVPFNMMGKRDFNSIVYFYALVNP
jgi:hypothetical protein